MSEQGIADAVGVSDSLCALGVPVPVPVSDGDGDRWQEMQDKKIGKKETRNTRQIDSQAGNSSWRLELPTSISR